MLIFQFGIKQSTNMDLQQLADTINSLLPEPQASLLVGMLFGVKTFMPNQFYDDLIITGTLHVIALSGMNISIIIRLLFDFFGRMLGKVAGVLLTLLGIGGFVWVVGPSPTIVRASLMGSLTVLAILTGRRNIPLLALGLSAVAMILFDWSLWKNISFQLSFLATLGIILFTGKRVLSMSNFEHSIASKPVEGVSEQLPEYMKISHGHSNLLNRMTSSFVLLVKEDLRITLSAQVFTLPVILYHFHRISLISPIANVATGWLVPPIMYIGFLMLLLAPLFRPLGYIVALVVWVPLTIFIWVVELMAKLPGASISF